MFLLIKNEIYPEISETNANLIKSTLTLMFV